MPLEISESTAQRSLFRFKDPGLFRSLVHLTNEQRLVLLNPKTLSSPFSHSGFVGESCEEIYSYAGCWKKRKQRCVHMGVGVHAQTGQISKTNLELNIGSSSWAFCSELVQHLPQWGLIHYWGPYLLLHYKY